MLNKWQLCSRISALGPKGHCTIAVSRKRCVGLCHVDRVWTSTRGGGPAHADACGQEGGRVKNLIFCGRHKWKASYGNSALLTERTGSAIRHLSNVKGRPVPLGFCHKSERIIWRSCICHLRRNHQSLQIETENTAEHLRLLLFILDHRIANAWLTAVIVVAVYVQIGHNYDLRNIQRQTSYFCSNNAKTMELQNWRPPLL